MLLRCVWGFSLLLLPTAAFAQDASSVWNGGYIGLDMSAGMGAVSVTDTNGGVPPGPFDYSTKNLEAGLTAGFNLQAGPFVLGVEGRVGYLDPMGSGLIPSSVPGHHQDLMITPGATGELVGRLGLGLDNTLLYVKGGASIFGGTSRQVTTNPGYLTEAAGPFQGWTAGIGIEQMLTANISIKAEYAHTVYSPVTGDQLSISDDPIGYRYYNDTQFATDTITVGLNAHF
jgi:outer membrane immunogenic protein